MTNPRQMRIFKLSLGLMLLLAVPLLAAESDEAKKAAMSHLNLVDKGQYAQLYADSAKVVTAAVTQPSLTSALKGANQMVGARQARKFMKISKHKDLNGQTGLYYVLRFNSSYAKLPQAAELLTVTQEGEVWKFAGYQVLKRQAVPAGF